MAIRTLASLLALLCVASACKDTKSSNGDIATAIERQFAKQRPDLDLARYARFYSYEPDGFVRGRYFFADTGHEPAKGRAGQAYWIPSIDDLPIVLDAGCAAVTVRYDNISKALVGIECDARE